MACPMIFLLALTSEDAGKLGAELSGFLFFDWLVLLLSCVGGFGISVSGTGEILLVYYYWYTNMLLFIYGYFYPYTTINIRIRH